GAHAASARTPPAAPASREASKLCADPLSTWKPTSFSRMVLTAGRGGATATAASPPSDSAETKFAGGGTNLSNMRLVSGANTEVTSTFRRGALFVAATASAILLT